MVFKKGLDSDPGYDKQFDSMDKRAESISILNIWPTARDDFRGVFPRAIELMFGQNAWADSRCHH